MLAKLIKYEFKATARTILPTFLGLFLFTILGRFSLGYMIGAGAEVSLASAEIIHISARRGDLLSFLSNLAMGLYGLAVLAVSVVVTIVIIQQFYKNLTGDEGYLMHTLPVKPGLLIWSKLLVAAVWELLMSGAIILSLGALFYQPAVWALIGAKFLEGWEKFASLFRVTPFLLMVMAAITLLSVLASTLRIYASIAIGHTTKNHRILGSILAYFGLSTVSSLVATPLALLFIAPNVTMDVYDAAAMAALSQRLFWQMTLYMAVLSLIMMAAYYFITNYVFTRQLNLE